MNQTPIAPAFTSYKPHKVRKEIEGGGVKSILYRGWLSSRSSNWGVAATGFLDPLLYLAAIGFGLGAYIGSVQYNGTTVPYAAFVIPGLLTVSAMNGAIYDSTWNVFFKIVFGKQYSVMLTTPLTPVNVVVGEVLLATGKGTLYAAAFLLILPFFGTPLTWASMAALAAAALISFGLASLGIALTSYITSLPQMEWISFAVLPMFMLSGTFFPTTLYPDWLQAVITASPLWQGIELVRSLMLGASGWQTISHVLYFVALACCGLMFATLRFRGLFLR